MSKADIVVSGATGRTGGALAHREDERSKRLQEKEVEVVFGDFLDFDAMRAAALKGTRRAYFWYPIRPGIVQTTAQFAQAAKEAGVDGIVNMSQISARPDSPSHAAQGRWLSEQVFAWSGVATANIRPNATTGATIKCGDYAIGESKLTATQTEAFGSSSYRFPIVLRGSTIIQIENGNRRVAHWSDYYDQTTSPRVRLGAFFEEWVE